VKQECQQVPRQSCRNVPRENCSSVPVQKQVAREVCTESGRY